MNLISLCSGYSGLEMGLAMSGLEPDLCWNLTAYAEFDKHASLVMERHHPGVQNLGDIKTCSWDTPHDIDILTAGYPCQPFSQSGKRLGADDPRHLWPYVHQAICHIRPRYVLLENVRGHLTLGLKEVLADLAGSGYVGSWICVRASDIDAPHRRERVFILAANATRPRERGIGWSGPRLQGAGLPAEDGHRPAARRDGWPRLHDLVPTTSDADGEQRSEHPQLHGDAAQDPSDRHPQGGHPCGRDHAAADPSIERQQRVGNSRGRRSGDPDRRDAAPDTHGTGLEGRTPLRERPDQRAARENGLGSPEQPVRSSPTDPDGRRPSHAVGVGRRPGAMAEPGSVEGAERLHRVSGADVDFGQYTAAVTRWGCLMGRRAPKPTDHNGRLSPFFVEWMMGLPLGHVTDLMLPDMDPRPGHLSRSQALKILGNGVVPQQAAHAINILVRRLPFPFFSRYEVAA